MRFADSKESKDEGQDKERTPDPEIQRYQDGDVVSMHLNSAAGTMVMLLNDEPQMEYTELPKGGTFHVWASVDKEGDHVQLLPAKFL